MKTHLNTGFGNDTKSTRKGGKKQVGLNQTKKHLHGKRNNKVKRQPIKWEKNVHRLCLIRDYYTKYTWNSYNHRKNK